MPRPSLDQTFIEVAKTLALRGTCIKMQVGCVMTDIKGRVLSTGWNGVHSGAKHCNELHDVPVYNDDPRVNLVTMAAPDYVAQRLKGKKIPTWVFGDKRTPKFKLAPGDKQCVGFDAVAINACNNGKPFPAGSDLCEAIHAEQNALLQCRDTDKIYTVYTTMSPCMRCVKELMNTSAQRIVFCINYDQPQAEELWRRYGRDWIQI
jgi:deoxycytidylate deaminase